MGILDPLLVCPDVLPTHSARLDTASHGIGLVKVLLELPVDGALFETGHGLCLESIRGRPLTFLNRKLELVEEAQGCPAFLLHDIMRHFAIEAYFQHPKGIFDQVKVVHFGLFVRSVQLVHTSYKSPHGSHN